MRKIRILPVILIACSTGAADKERTTMPRFLHAACGNSDKSRTTQVLNGPDWEEVRMDASPDVKPDIVSSLTDMKDVKPASFDAVFTTRSLEKLYPHEVITALANILRVLTVDGYLIVSCADLQAACALIAEGKLLEPAYDSPAGPIAPIDILYGFRPALASGQLQHACRCGFTTKALIGTLAQAGFASIWSARNPSTFTIAAIATKTERPESYLTELAHQHFG